MTHDARDKLIAELRRDGTGRTGMSAALLVENYLREVAANLREDTRRGYRPNSTRYQHYMEAADHIDPDTRT